MQLYFGRSRQRESWAPENSAAYYLVTRLVPEIPDVSWLVPEMPDVSWLVPEMPDVS
jgi:hypothetical protein